VLRVARRGAMKSRIQAGAQIDALILTAPERKVRPWTAEEARQFLESVRRDEDVLYAAYVLLLVLGLRKGELLGLTWEQVSLDNAELYVGEQIQRVGRQLLRRHTKTEGFGGSIAPPGPVRDRAQASRTAAGRRPVARC
jgi:integrase